MIRYDRPHNTHETPMEIPHIAMKTYEFPWNPHDIPMKFHYGDARVLVF